MSLDLSRVSFDARRDFLGVVMQQGRVQLDSDWNEWVAQLARRIQAGTLDTVGRAVVPRETPDGFHIEAAAGEMTIGSGRIYVDGLLAENHGEKPGEWNRQLAELVGVAPIDYDQQPYRPDLADTSDLPETPGPHLVYLDVWQREVSHLQDPDLVEKAVGLDSTGRLQTVWQVKVLPDVGANLRCDTAATEMPTSWLNATRPSAGRLSTGTGDLPDEPDPCEVPPAAAYEGQENQLYRVEIHRGGPVGTATFKWSRDNATVAACVTAINPSRTKLTVDSLGRDNVLRFNHGDWVEITDDWRELNNLPGELRRITPGTGVNDDDKTITLETALPLNAFPVDGLERTFPARHTRVRRWDQSGQVRREDGSAYANLDAAGSTGEILVPPGGVRLFLELGILVQFSLQADSEEDDGEFKSGDYWVFAARSVDASIEVLDQAPPRGIHHHYARLAIVTFPDAESDCRTLWPPATDGECCDCSICVDAATHNDGSATIQHAIAALRDRGGTICLGLGVFEIDPKQPILLDDVSSLRLRGQGWGTILKGSSPGTVLAVSHGVNVVLENFSVLGSTVDEGATAIATVADVIGFQLDQVNVLGFSETDAGAALELAGYMIKSGMTECVLVAQNGVVGSRDEKRPLLTLDFRLRDNILVCRARAVHLDAACVHVGTMEIARNLSLGCTKTSITALGGVPPGSCLDIARNLIYAEGEGIRAGANVMRIQDNEISGHNRGGGTGIVLDRGLDPKWIEDVRIIGNRIQNLSEAGIAILQRVERAMIKQNTVSAVGAAGLLMVGVEGTGHIVVENNQFTDLARSRTQSKGDVVGLAFAMADRVDVLNNLVSDVARDTVDAPMVAGISSVGVKELRLAGNRIHGIGADRSGRPAAAIRVATPFEQVAVDDNSVDRAADDSSDVVTAPWEALRIEGRREDKELVGTTPTGGYTHIGLKGHDILLSAEKVHSVPHAANASVTVRRNRIRAQSTREPLVTVRGVETCLFAENHCEVVREGAAPGPQIGDLQGNVVNASNNRLVAVGDQQTLRIQANLVKGREVAEIAVGNIGTGEIIFGHGPLLPWKELNFPKQ